MTTICFYLCLYLLIGVCILFFTQWMLRQPTRLRIEVDELDLIFGFAILWPFLIVEGLIFLLVVGLKKLVVYLFNKIVKR